MRQCLHQALHPSAKTRQRAARPGGAANGLPGAARLALPRDHGFDQSAILPLHRIHFRECRSKADLARIAGIYSAHHGIDEMRGGVASNAPGGKIEDRLIRVIALRRHERLHEHAQSRPQRQQIGKQKGWGAERHFTQFSRAQDEAVRRIGISADQLLAQPDAPRQFQRFGRIVEEALRPPFADIAAVALGANIPTCSIGFFEDHHLNLLAAGMGLIQQMARGSQSGNARANHCHGGSGNLAHDCPNFSRTNEARQSMKSGEPFSERTRSNCAMPALAAIPAYKMSIS